MIFWVLSPHPRHSSLLLKYSEWRICYYHWIYIKFFHHKSKILMTCKDRVMVHAGVWLQAHMVEVLLQFNDPQKTVHIPEDYISDLVYAIGSNLLSYCVWIMLSIIIRQLFIKLIYRCSKVHLTQYRSDFLHWALSHHWRLSLNALPSNTQSR